MKPKNQPLQASNKVFKKVPASLAVGKTPSLKEPHLIGNWILWLEQRPDEGGRTTVLFRPWNRNDLKPQELTPAPRNLRSNVHGYGGGLIATIAEENNLILAWSETPDGSVWTQTWEGLNKEVKEDLLWLTPKTPAIRISKQGTFSLADGLIDSVRQIWIGVMEKDGQDFLVSLSLKKAEQKPKIIYKPRDFIGYATLSPNGRKIAWVEWEQNSMPWDASQLWLGELTDSGNIIKQSLIAGHKDSRKVSIFQPYWLSNDELVASEDSNGWWNIIKANICPGENIIVIRDWQIDAETAMPQWVYGMRTISSIGPNLLVAFCKNARWSLNLLKSNGDIQRIDQPFDDISGISAQNDGKIFAIASNSLSNTGLLEIDIKKQSWRHYAGIKSILNKEAISIAEPFWFKGYNQQKTHAWYYPPKTKTEQLPPLLVKSHSGPTSMASTGLHLGIQFWTSRGWAVVDVNYGGSTGFGRKYRERLLGRWGEVDVQDCSLAAKALIKAGKVDSKRIAIEGGSAGGYTTLACLCFTDIFKVGACRYAVSDLTSMANNTHRFEARYLDSLIGDWHSHKERYKALSPLFNSEKISCPVIFFQGMKDKVVPAEHCSKMAAALSKNNIPTEIYMFKEEGHGFKDGKTQIKVLNETERFFRQHLNIQI